MADRPQGRPENRRMSPVNRTVGSGSHEGFTIHILCTFGMMRAAFRPVLPACATESCDGLTPRDIAAKGEARSAAGFAKQFWRRATLFLY